MAVVRKAPNATVKYIIEGKILLAGVYKIRRTCRLVTGIRQGPDLYGHRTK